MFAAVNAATALRHAMEHAIAARARMAEQLTALAAEDHDLQLDAERAAGERGTAAEGLERARAAMETLRLDRAARESELTGARSDRDVRAQSLRTAEHELASVNARRTSLEELDAARVQYGDGARTVLAESPDDVGQMGSVADYLEVDRRYERAVEACLGERLQHVVVASHAHAARGVQLVRERSAGRVGFVIAPPEGVAPMAAAASSDFAPAGLTPLAEILRISGPAADVIRASLSHTWVAEGFAAAVEAIALCSQEQRADRAAAVIVTLDGDVFRGGHIVEGGLPAEARGILATKREIKELRERADTQAAAVERLRGEVESPRPDDCRG